MSSPKLVGDDGGMAALLHQGAAASEGSARLLERFAGSRDEAAFAALVARHGPMVRAACRRLLPNPADADDAFQATFLVLARRAGGLGDGDRLAPWLHGVARRVAARSRRGNARRRQREVSNREPNEASQPVDSASVESFELRSILDEELARLPSKYRDPLILCGLDGLTSDEAAHQLGWPVGTVRTRLAGGRDRLRSRLARRGYAPGALLILSPATLPTAAVSPLLQATTVRLALSTLAVSAPGAPTAVLLARGVVVSMLTTKLQTAALAVAATATLAVGSVGLIHARGPTFLGPAPPDPSSGIPAIPPPTIVPLAPSVPADDLEVARARIKALEAELAARSTPTAAPAAAPSAESDVPNFPPIPVDPTRPGHAALQPPGPTVTAEQVFAAYFNAWTFPLPDGWKLESPRERDRAIVSKPGAGQSDTFESPGQFTTVVPVVSGELAGLMLAGPKISEVAAYSPIDHRWSRQALQGAPINGKVMPLILGGMIEYTVGRHIYAYSPKANRWGVLELAVAPAANIPAGSILGPPGMTIPEGDIRHIFDAATGEWTHQTKDGQAVPTPATTPPKPDAPSESKAQPPAKAAQPRRPTLQKVNGLLMSISAEGDRVVMFDPKTERRATLRLTQPVSKMTPEVLTPPLDQSAQSTKEPLPTLIALGIGGSAVRQVALFDQLAFQWHQFSLADPVISVRPRVAGNTTRGWVTFDLVGNRVTEAPTFSYQTHAWDAGTLDQPPQPSAMTAMGPDDLKVTRSGWFYHFRRLDGGPVVRFEAKVPAYLLGLAPRSDDKGLVTIDQLGLTLGANGTYCVQDGDTLNIVDPKTMTLRRINLAEEGDPK